VELHWKLLPPRPRLLLLRGSIMVKALCYKPERDRGEWFLSI
jgi:hypothetical protein